MSYGYYPGDDDEQNATGLVIISVVILALIVFLFGGMVKFQPFSGGDKAKAKDSSSQNYSPPSFARPCKETSLVLKTPKRLADCKKAKGYAWELLKHDKEQFKCLDELWVKESGWDDEILNKSSGAAGIPQALGHGKVFKLGDWKAQVRWGVNYIKKRYKNACSALSFWNRTDPRPYGGHWY